MKFRTNLGFRLEALTRGLWALGSLAGLAGLGLALWFVADARELSRLAPKWEAMRENLAARRANLAPGPGPSKADMDSLGERMKALARIGGGQGRSSLALLDRLEGQLPPRARLASFRHDLSLGQAACVAQARDIEDLSAFLISLEKDGGFQEVLLSRQGRNAEGWTEFDLKLAERAEAAP